jgi:hypothetical protein
MAQHNKMATVQMSLQWENVSIVATREMTLTMRINGSVAVEMAFGMQKIQIHKTLLKDIRSKMSARAQILPNPPPLPHLQQRPTRVHSPRRAILIVVVKEAIIPAMLGYEAHV